AQLEAGHNQAVLPVGHVEFIAQNRRDYGKRLAIDEVDDGSEEEQGKDFPADVIRFQSASQHQLTPRSALYWFGRKRTARDSSIASSEVTSVNSNTFAVATMK